MLTLIREGLTNEQIAQRLDISYDGAKYHVSEILSKLGVSSREEAAAWTPEERRPLWAGAPLLGSLLGRLSLGTAAKAAGVVVTAAALGGIGLLVWGLLVTNGPDEAGPAVSQPTGTGTPADGGAPPGPAAGNIAFVSRRDGNAEIYTVQPDGGNLSRLVSDPAEQGNIAWAPDGSRLAFYSLRDERWQLDIVDADGAGLTTIADGLVTGHDPIPPVWSPDGSRLAFESEHEGDMEVYVVNADGTGLTNLSRNATHDSGPSWSPDGSRIAFSSDRGGNADIYVMNADGSGVIRLTEHPAVDTAPAWSPHGDQVAFMSFRDGEAEIYTVNADGSGLTNVTRNPTADFPGGPVGHDPPAWSPDGSRIAFVSDRDGNAEVYVAGADGSGVTRLTEDPADDFSPAWSPDGSWVTFVSLADGNPDVYVVAADGSGLARLTDAPQADGPGVWQPVPDEETSGFVPPEEKAGPLRLRLSFGDGLILKWDDLRDEAGYTVEGSVKYGPPCELVEQGFQTTEEFEFNRQLAADAVEFAIPKPVDERLSVTLELVLEATATDIYGAPLVADSMAFTGDPICP